MVNFLLNACQELVDTAREMSEANRALPYAPSNASYETSQRVTDQKNRWIIGSERLGRLAGKCILPTLRSYINYRETAFGGQSDVDAPAERALTLISSWNSAPYMALGIQPMDKTRGKFLEIYFKQYGYSRTDQLPPEWYQAVIFGGFFHLMACFSNKEKTVLPQVIEFLKKAATWEKVEPSLTTLRETVVGRPVVNYLTSLLCENGNLDQLVKLKS